MFLFQAIKAPTAWESLPSVLQESILKNIVGWVYKY